MSEPVSQRRRSWWGWGWEDQALTGEQIDGLAGTVAARLGVDDLEVRPAPKLADLDLRPPRVDPPAALAGICSADVYDRAGHTYGKSFRDVVRAFEADLPEPPDLVAFPNDEADVVDLLGWCAEENIAAIPYGGGSSVVGGVETGGGWAAGYRGVVSIDLSRLDRVLD